VSSLSDRFEGVKKIWFSYLQLKMWRKLDFHIHINKWKTKFCLFFQIWKRRWKENAPSLLQIDLFHHHEDVDEESLNKSMRTLMKCQFIF
jgi:hypothetical protein